MEIEHKPASQEEQDKYINPAARKWIEALRSGKYKQGRGRLCDGDGGYCCLGVATHLHRPKFKIPHNRVSLYIDELLAYNLATANGHTLFGRLVSTSVGPQEFLTQMNDRGVPFLEIADILEAYPGLFFCAIDAPKRVPIDSESLVK